MGNSLCCGLFRSKRNTTSYTPLPITYEQDILNNTISSPLPSNRFTEVLDDLSNLTISPISNYKSQNSCSNTLSSFGRSYSHSYTIGSWNIGDRLSHDQKQLTDKLITEVLSARPPDVLFIQEGASVNHIVNKILNPDFFPGSYTGVSKRVMGSTNRSSSTILSSIFNVLEQLDLPANGDIALCYNDQKRVCRFSDLFREQGIDVNASYIGTVLDRSIVLLVEHSITEDRFIFWNYHGKRMTKEKLCYTVTLLKMCEVFTTFSNYPVVVGGDFNMKLLQLVSVKDYQLLRDTFHL
ncbi:hypothetical protein GEMRC1_007213 [Eukaryota sp. GEM-RC1]